MKTIRKAVALTHRINDTVKAVQALCRTRPSPQEGISPSDQRITSAKLTGLVVVLTGSMLTATSLLAQTKFIDFQFNEANGTQSDALVNAGNYTPFAGVKFDYGSFVTQDGNLNFGATKNYKGPNPNQAKNGGGTYRSLNFPSTLTSANGDVTFEYKISDWNLGGNDASNNTAGNGLLIRVLSSTGSNNGIHLLFQVNQTGDDITVQTSAAGTGLTGTAQDQLGNLGLVNTPTPTPVTVQLRADLSTGSWSSKLKIGNGAWIPLVTNGTGLTAIGQIQVVTQAPYTALTDINVTALVVGSSYTIKTIGDTTLAQWTALGADSTPAVDEIFVAKGAGAGTGVVSRAGTWEYTTVEGTAGEYLKLDYLTLASTEQFTLALNPTPVNGTVEGVGNYFAGRTATLTATPNFGYSFTGWTGDASGINNPLSVVMDANKTIGATFTPLTRTLTISPTPVNGTVSGAGDYAHGTTATVTATAASGYSFTGWTGNASGTINPLSLVMDGNKTVGANFILSNLDTDGDGLLDRYETGTGIYVSEADTGTSPTNSDSSGDGALDGESVTAGLDPNVNYTPVLNRLRTRVGESPGAFNLYTQSALMDLNVGRIGLQRTGDVNQLTIQLQYKTAPDGTQWLELVEETETIVMPGDRGFIRLNILGVE
ncbi:MAG: hypothetical protein O3B89_03480 [Verrucomicrobia bacterium]|nr:hypothetical protein [Verrucomicrobiota bacterium]